MKATLKDLLTEKELKSIEGICASYTEVAALPVFCFQQIAAAIVTSIPQGATSLYVAALMVLDKRANEKGLSII